MTALNGHVSVPLHTARALLKLGIHTIPVRFKAKTVTRDGWIYERWGEADLEGQFDKQTNIGVLVGEASNNLGDCDLDSAEAVALGPLFLPATNMDWGRPGKRHSHIAYFLDHVGPKNLSFKDPLIKKTDADSERRAMLCELRMKGQSLAPGSVHPNGETIDWTDLHADHTPSSTTYDILHTAIGRVAAGALLARYWVEGIRHDATLPLAGMLCRGGMDENQAVHFVESMCTTAGESPEDVANRVAAVSDTYARAERGEHFTGGATLEEFFDPRIVARVREWLELSKFAYAGDIGPDGWPLSDIGNAERFVQKYRGHATYCPEEGAWYLYNERWWERDRKNGIYRLAMDVVNDFRNIAHSPRTASRGNTTPDQWKKHAERMGAMKQVRAMLELAGALVPSVPEDFDADPLVLNVQNGTLELNVRSGEVYMREYRADDMLTMACPVHYRAHAFHPLFDEYLDRFFPEQERREFLQLHAGYIVSGMPKRYALQLIGPTNAGKSMTLELFSRVLGEYAGTLKYDSLMRNPHKGGDTPRSDLWNIRNKRLVTVSEIPPDTHYDVALFKSLLSGGDKQLVRTLFDRTGGLSIAFAFALWTSGNQPYGPPSGEEAAYERLHVLWCKHPVERQERDEQKQQTTLDPSVTGEAVLAWMLAGFTRLYGELHGRLIPPDSVQQHTRAMQNDLDPWTAILEPDDPDKRIVEFTGDPGDGVLKSEVWQVAKEQRELQFGVHLRASQQIKYEFESAMRRRCGDTKQSKARWNNRDYWPGVRWMPRLVEQKVVTPADWSRGSA